MKKYSTNYPLIFGIFFLIVGIDAGQIPIILLFGVVPIVASVLMKWSDHKAKKQGKETRTERANRIYQETMKASGKNAQVKKIGDKKYCDVCGQVVLKSAIVVSWRMRHRVLIMMTLRTILNETSEIGSRKKVKTPEAG